MATFCGRCAVKRGASVPVLACAISDWFDCPTCGEIPSSAAIQLGEGETFALLDPLLTVTGMEAKTTQLIGYDELPPAPIADLSPEGLEATGSWFEQALQQPEAPALPQSAEQEEDPILSESYFTN